MERPWIDEFLSAALWIQSLKGGWDHFYTAGQQNSIQHKHFHFLLYKFLISAWARPFHSRATISPSMWFPPRTWVVLPKNCMQGASGGREKSIQDWLSLLLAYPPRLSHVKSFSLPCRCLLGLQPFAGQSGPITHGWGRDYQRNSQWLVKRIFIWRTNDPTLKGNESLSEQPVPSPELFGEPNMHLSIDWPMDRALSKTGFALVMSLW